MSRADRKSIRKVVSFTPGERFGRIVAVGFSYIKGAGKRGSKSYWKFRCDCGKEIVSIASNVKSGLVTSCGCARSEKTIKRNVDTALHGMSHSREHRTWASMLQRCRDPNHNEFHRYGGRGITICERWLTFTNFLADMGPRPEGKTLDRYPNGDGNYEPENCRWATLSEQNKNRKPFKRVPRSASKSQS